MRENRGKLYTNIVCNNASNLPKNTQHTTQLHRLINKEQRHSLVQVHLVSSRNKTNKIILLVK